MKRTAYATVEGAASVTIAVPETSGIVRVEGRYETACPFEIARLDAHPNVTRAPRRAPDTDTDTPTPKGDA